jgi:ABC-type glycerol-3-phosphate transport system permease component
MVNTLYYGYTPTRETINVGITGAATTPENLIIAASAMAAIPTIIFFLIFQMWPATARSSRCSAAWPRQRS